jgi:transposase
LKRWGFTFQKPAFSAYEQDPHEVQNWLSEAYPRLKSKAGRQQGLVLWMDELGLRSRHTCTKRQNTGNRFYLTMLTAISNRGHLIFLVAEGRFNRAEFLKKLLRSVRQKVFLITDNHPVHLGKMIGEWLWANPKKIEVFYLPNYSLEQNPVEYMNRDIKTNGAGKRRATNVEELKRAVEAFANRKKKNQENVKKYFHAPSVKYAAAPN